MRYLIKSVPLVLVIVLIGAGCFGPKTTTTNSTSTPAIVTSTPIVQPVGETPFTIRLVDQAEQYAIEFPEKLYVQRTAEGTSLVHAVPFPHQNPCDMKDGATIPLLTDYKLTLTSFSKNQLADFVTKKYSPEFAKDYLDGDWFKVNNNFIEQVTVGAHTGVRFDMGAEGCGVSTYVLSLTSSTLLVAEQPFGNITSRMLGPDDVREKARQLPGIILNENLNQYTEQILASATPVQSTGSVVGFIRPPSSTEMIAYSSENNFSFRYPAHWAAQVTPRSFGIDYDIVPSLVAGFIPPAGFKSGNRVTLKSAASVFINAETEGFTLSKEVSEIINNKEWHRAEYERLPGGSTAEKRLLAIGPHLLREDLGFLVQLNYPVDKDAAARVIFERILNTIGPRP